MKGRASVLPAGSLPPTGNRLSGKFEITITGIQEEGESSYVNCRYPDGFARDHQVKDMEALIPKLVNQIRARFGNEEVKTISIPTTLDVGEVIVMEAPKWH